MNKALEENTPSLFIVASPFQALCAIEAVASLNISNYKFIACLGGSLRDKQLLNLLESKGINYISENFNGIKYFQVFASSLMKKNRTNYHRAFLGDSENVFLRHCAYKYLSNNSIIAYVDDGTKDIPLLMGKRKRKRSNYFIIECLIRFVLKIKLKDAYFTLFSDVATNDFECKANNFSNIKNHYPQIEPKGVYFVGTNSIMYCKKLNVPMDSFLYSLKQSLSAISEKYKNQPIYYIPHGKDKNAKIKELVEKLNIHYTQIDKTVELFIMEQPNKPFAIYSNTSTALFNLKKLYPDAEIYNIFYLGDEKSKYYKDYLTYSEYFLKHGIFWIKTPQSIC